MGVAESLRRPQAHPASEGRTACPRCGEDASAYPVVPSSTLGRSGLRRCPQCATRWSVGSAGPEYVFTCDRCGLPFLSDVLLSHGEHRCADCEEGHLPPELPSAVLAAATDHEIRTALAKRWRVATSPGAQAYLDRIARQVAARIESAPDDVRVVLVDDTACRSLALPSGTLLVSGAFVAFLEDEAELAFVLGHEIAHAASGDAAVRLSRLGFKAASREEGARDETSWADAAEDLCRLGYGRKRERDADARAVEAMLALGYDPGSSGRYLARLHAAAAAGSPVVSDLALAHPTATDRARRIEKMLYGRVAQGGAALKVNREVFRRAVPHDLPARLTPVRLDASPGRPFASFEDAVDESGSRALVWGAIAVGALLAAAAVAYAWLAG